MTSLDGWEPVRGPIKGVGWISQFLLADGETWVSWTQWLKREAAEQHVQRFLETHADYRAGRVTRVDWTVVATFPGQSAAPQDDETHPSSEAR